jgi:hypothetical protein
MELVAYAVLIYETFNRPWLAQSFERLVFPWFSHTLGPMQLRTSKRITNRESVALGIHKLRQTFETSAQEPAGKSRFRYQAIYSSLAKYNKDDEYISEVLMVLRTLSVRVATAYKLEFETIF